MGFFGTYLYDGRQWTEHDSDREVDLPDSWLLVNIHDSDFTIVGYQPRYGGAGVAYLGHTPRMYFEDATDPTRTDTEREAAALTAWWAEHGGGAGDPDPRTKHAELLGYLAEDLEEFEAFDEDDDFEDDELDEGEIFVEVKTARFLTALGLPVPVELRR